MSQPYPSVPEYSHGLSAGLDSPGIHVCLTVSPLRLVRNLSKSYFIIFICIPNTSQSSWHSFSKCPCWMQQKPSGDLQHRYYLIHHFFPLSLFLSKLTDHLTYISASPLLPTHTYISHLFFHPFLPPSSNSYSTILENFSCPPWSSLSTPPLPRSLNQG